MIDLHCHSFFSDGQESYEQIRQGANKVNLRLYSVTDHNYINPDAKPAVGFMQGVEVSAKDPQSGVSLHILGYSKKFDIEKLNKAFTPIIDGYNARANRIILALNKKFNIRLDFNELSAATPAPFLSRNHIALALRGVVSDLDQPTAIKAAFVSGEDDSFMFNPNQAIDTIISCGGAAVLAHPGNLIYKIDLHALVNRLSARGLRGIEAYYPRHSPENTKMLLDIAHANNCVITAGSDWHGPDFSKTNLGTTMSDADEEACINFMESI